MMIFHGGGIDTDKFMMDRKCNQKTYGVTNNANQNYGDAVVRTTRSVLDKELCSHQPILQPNKSAPGDHDEKELNSLT